MDEAVWNFFNTGVQYHFIYSSRAQLEPEDNRYSTLFKFNMHLTRDVLVYERDEYTILEFIGDVSALYQALQMIGYSILLYVLRLDVLVQNKLLNSVFRKVDDTKPYRLQRLDYTYWRWCRR